MPSKYDKNNILLAPELSPKRHYESEGVLPSYKEPSSETTEPEEPLLEVLDELDRVYRLAALLPQGLTKIIRDIVNELLLDTQGKIILNLEEKKKNPPKKENEPSDIKYVPGKGYVTTPKKTTTTYPSTGYIQGTTPSSDSASSSNTPETAVRIPPEIIPFPDPADEPTPEYIEPPQDDPEERTISTQEYEPIGAWDTVIDTATGDGEFVADIFSRDPIFTVSAEPTKNLVDLSKEAYQKDDSDIKKYFTNKMIDLSQRFFQVMDTMATEAGMPDHSFLLQNFDGTAVRTKYPDKQHLIDYICKNQVIYDQKERFMRKTHTPRNTLIHMRSMTSSEAQRERYLKEEYSEDKSTYIKDFSNDLLEKSRAIANNNYKESAYNFFKYLNSAVEQTNTMLNIKIDEGAAKAELAATGSDIYAYTPPPNATTWNLDDNKQSVDDQTKKAQDALTKQSSDSVTGQQAVGGGGTDGSGGYGDTFNGVYETVDIAEAKIPVITGAVSSANPKADLANKIGFAIGVPPALVWCQMAHETGGFTSELSTQYHNHGGVKGAGSEYGVYGSDSRNHSYFSSDNGFMQYMIHYYPLYEPEGLLQAKTIEQWAAALKKGNYFTDSLSNYVYGLLRWYNQMAK